MWTGSAASVVDLHPSEFSGSEAFGVSDGQQVGFGVTGDGSRHALLWTGSAESVIDLHPSGFFDSQARGASGGQQVGFGFDGVNRALLWTGSAESVVDLNAFLPPGFTDAQARGIDADGNIVGAAFGLIGGEFRGHAFLWKPTVIPEPSTIALLGIGLTGIVIAGRRRKRAGG